MKNIIPFPLLLCCFVFVAPMMGQEETTTVNTGDWASSVQVRLIQEMFSADYQGKLSFLKVTNNADQLVFVGLSEEQIDLLYSKMEEFEEQSEEFRNLEQRLKNSQNLPPDKLVELEDDLGKLFSELFDRVNKSFREALTPEQLQKIQELELASPTLFEEMFAAIGKDIFINLSAYNALELSEEQQGQLRKIQKETEPEYRETLKEFLSKISKSVQNENDPQEILKAFAEKAQKLTARTKSRILALLTKEQTVKLEKILKEVPEKLAKIKKDIPEDDEWKKSWKPGDPVPEGATPPRIYKPFPFL